MKPSIINHTILCLLLLAVTPLPAAAQNQMRSRGSADSSPQNPCPQAIENLDAQLNHLREEVRELKAALAEQRLRTQRNKLAQLERKLGQLQAEQRLLQEQERITTQELSEMEKLLGSASLAADERTALEEFRTRLADEGLQRLRAAQQTLAQQEAELTQRLEQEKQQLQELVERAKGADVEVGEPVKAQKRPPGASRGPR